ncbi:hypothetical protein MKX01_012117 [Papaver californicum]|nr:hypothetical protein MKX01_012117 [Papaver californicum]
MIPTTDDFCMDKDEPDRDTPTSGFTSVDEAIEDIRQCKMVIVVDDENRENERDLIMAAELAAPEAMVTTTTGEGGKTSYSIHSNSARECPLKTWQRQEGGILQRAGHTEASVDLAVLAGFDPVAVLCEIVDDDGSMARLPKLCEFAQRENLKIILIADLIRKWLSWRQGVNVLNLILPKGGSYQQRVLTVFERHQVKSRAGCPNTSGKATVKCSAVMYESFLV